MLLGPVNFIMDVSVQNQAMGGIILVLCVVGFVAPFVERNKWTHAAALAAALLWFISGVVGEAISA